MAEANPTTAGKRLHDKSFGVASFRSNRWRADLEEHQTLEDALREGFWANQADKIVGHDKLNPRGVGDIIEIFKRDTMQFMELLIVGIGPGYVRVAPMRAFEPKVAAEPDDAPLTTRWNVSKRGHEVIRKDDRSVMAGPFQNKDAAVTWIENHLKAMAA